MTDISLELAQSITDNVRAVIRAADANNPRTLQQAIGPSEYGHPCQRRIAYKVMQHPETNTAQDPWKRNVGTAVHSYLEHIYSQLDETLPDGRRRYELEQRVQPPGAPAGSCDLYDRKLRTVVDWKTTSPTRLKEIRRTNDVGPAYATQAHTYGAGWQAAGEQVDHVAVVFLPRNGDLADLHVWTEPYDPAVVEAAANRLHSIVATAVALDVEQHPERFALISAEPSRLCAWCPYYLPMSTNPGQGCPGNTADLTANGVLMSSPPTTRGTKEQAA
jgi:hypothetical protein